MDAESLKTYLNRYPFRELADENGAPNGHFMTCPVRVAFANLATPRERVNPKTGEKSHSFGCVLIVPAAADLTIPKAIASRAALAKFGPNFKNMELRNPFRPQAKNAGKYDGFDTEGVYFDVESRFVVPIIGSRKGADGTFPKLDPASPAVYSGMWAIARLSVYDYHTTGNRGVKFGLRALQKLADDDEFKGGDGTDAFGEIDHSGVVAHGGNSGVSAPARAPAMSDSDW